MGKVCSIEEGANETPPLNAGLSFLLLDFTIVDSCSPSEGAEYVGSPKGRSGSRDTVEWKISTQVSWFSFFFPVWGLFAGRPPTPSPVLVLLFCFFVGENSEGLADLLLELFLRIEEPSLDCFLLL